MASKQSPSPDPGADEIAVQASLWLARRDRGLTPAEQDEYLEWLGSDPRHPAVLARHAAALERMMRLYEWQPGESAQANPDLFAPRRTRPWTRWGLSLAAAAALVLGGVGIWRRDLASEPPLAQRTFLRVNDSQLLPDGSVVELRDGSRIELAFTSGERRVRLAGEAHFTVAKAPLPFVVQVDGISVLALGTVFNVRSETEVLEVLVTEGRVAVQPHAAGGLKEGRNQGEQESLPATLAQATTQSPGGEAEGSSVPRAPHVGTLVTAGHRAVVLREEADAIQVSEATRDQVKTALAWQVPRLQFFETPLAVAVNEFNQRNRVRLVIGQRSLERVPIGGTFGVDNVEGFVRLLEITHEIRAQRRGEDTIVLTHGL